MCLTMNVIISTRTKQISKCSEIKWHLENIVKNQCKRVEKLLENF